MTQMKIDLDGIGHALADHQLRVPRFQREYAWIDKHVTDLYQDIAAALDGGEAEYFLGSIVVVGSGGSHLEVVDGQQRLATTTILIAAIRDYFFNANEVDRAVDIERKYLKERDIATQEYTPHLFLNQSDHDFFVKKVLARPSDPERAVAPQRESHKRIARAAVLASEQVAHITKSKSRAAERLLRWLAYIHNNIRIIWVLVPDQLNAFRIFETLNDRGLALAITDLLKNHLFSVAADRIEEVQQRWTMMISAFDEEELVLSYIRHYWMSVHGVTRERELYQRIKTQVSSKQSAVDLADDLAKNAPLYQAITNPDEAFEKKYGPEARNDMAALNILGMVQMRPLLLAILECFSPLEVRKALHRFVAWAVRFVTVGGLGGGTLERHYAQRAVEVRQGQHTKARHLTEVMQRVVPSDLEFRTAYTTVSEPKAKIARYYLRALELAAGAPKPAKIPNPDTDAVNLEHVLPQNPSTAWGPLPEDLVKAYANRLGNLALLEKKINSSIANQGFAAKRKELESSPFVLTSAVAEYATWGPDEIDDRQAKLAALAVKTWRV